MILTVALMPRGVLQPSYYLLCVSYISMDFSCRTILARFPHCPIFAKICTVRKIIDYRFHQYALLARHVKISTLTVYEDWYFEFEFLFVSKPEAVVS